MYTCYRNLKGLYFGSWIQEFQAMFTQFCCFGACGKLEHDDGEPSCLYRGGWGPRKGETGPKFPFKVELPMTCPSRPHSYVFVTYQ